jgi:hypothetical protein
MSYVSSARWVSSPVGRTDITVFIKLIVIIRSSRRYGVSSKSAQNFRPQNTPPYIGLFAAVPRNDRGEFDTKLSQEREAHITRVMPNSANRTTGKIAPLSSRK